MQRELCIRARVKNPCYIEVILDHPQILAFVSPIKLEWMNWWQATLLFLALATPIVLLAIRSLAGLGPVRRWIALVARLLVLLIFVLILAGARWQRQNKDLEVMVLRDISESTSNVHDFTGTSLQDAVDNYLKSITQDKYKPNRADKLGVISFKEDALIDAPPEEKLQLDTRAMRDPGHGTDTAAAIQLALASLHKDAMHRLLLVWDGNATAGDLNNALSAAVAQHVPIDVMPLKYNVTNEVMMERFNAPMWKRENEPFTMDIVLNSTNAMPVTGKLTVRHGSEMLDLDPAAPGPQPVRLVTLKPGLNVEHVFVPALGTTGVHQFVANFEGENVTIENGKAGKQTIAGDTLLQNNTASTFTFVRGKGKVLCIDNVPQGQGKILRDALTREGIALDESRTTVDQFPGSIVELQNYDAVILANVPRGPSGLSEDQQKMLATYVHDMGGGLIMIGGEQSFGAGGWGGSKLEEVLPVNMDIPAQRQVPKGALVMAIHSCEMPQGNYWGEQCALEAAKTLSSRDEVGVISYAWSGPNGGGSQWDFPLAEKGDGSKLLSAVKAMQLGDMPDFDDMLNVALHGGSKGEKGLIDSDARQRCATETHHHHLRRRSRHAVTKADQGLRRSSDQHLDRHRLHAYPRHAQPADGADGQAHARPSVWTDREKSQPASPDLHQGSNRRSPQPDFHRQQGDSGKIRPQRRGHREWSSVRRAAGDGAGPHQQKAQPPGRHAAHRRRQRRSAAGVLAGGSRPRGRLHQ